MLRLRLGYAIMAAGIVLSLISAAMLVGKYLVGTAITFGVAVLLFYGGVIVVATAGTREERKKRQAQMERWATVLGMALGRASGGWTPRRHERKAPRRAKRPN